MSRQKVEYNAETWSKYIEQMEKPLEPELTPVRQIRISDNERNVVIDQLQKATGEGRLTLVEFEDRARQVYAAQFSADLEPITADLPVIDQVSAIRADQKPKRRWLVSIMGGNDRTGSWDPGDGVIAFTMMGGQTLDLTQVAATEVSIFAVTVMGGTEIIVPDGATVDMSGFMIFGGSSNETIASGNSPMRVKITAVGGMGACEVRNLSGKEVAKRAKRLDR